MKAAALILLACFVLASPACKRRSQDRQGDSITPLPQQREIAAHSDSTDVTEGMTTEDLLQQWRHEQLAVRHGLEWLGAISRLKRQFWNYHLLNALDANDASKLSQEEKSRIHATLMGKMGWKDSVYRTELALLATVAATPEALNLKSEAEKLVTKWDERFPNVPDLIVTREDLEGFEQEIKPIMDQLKRLPRLTPKQLQEEIATLPPPEKPHAVRDSTG